MIWGVWGPFPLDLIPVTKPFIWAECGAKSSAALQCLLLARRPRDMAMGQNPVPPVNEHPNPR